MILEIKNLCKNFGSIAAANNINFKMRKKEVIGVIGSNGAGKTTFCNIITGYTKADSGEIYLNKKNITNKSVQEIKDLGIHRSFQIPQIFENLSVLDNIIISILVASGKQNNFLENSLKNENIQLADRMLNNFNLIENRETKVSDLPQGIRKILDIIIAIQGKPSIVLLDEPTSGISSDEKNKIMENIIITLESLGIAVIFIEHDMEIVENFSKRVVAFYNGEIIADDSPQKVFLQKDVKKYIVG